MSSWEIVGSSSVPAITRSAVFHAVLTLSFMQAGPEGVLWHCVECFSIVGVGQGVLCSLPLQVGTL